MKTSPTRAMMPYTLATTVGFALLGCGDIIDGNNHRCEISYNTYWEDTDLELLHWEPRKCPIPISSHEGFADLVDFSATVTDPGFDDVRDFLHLYIINSVGVTVDDEIEPFNSQGGDGVAEPTVTYRAATGTLYGSENPDDEGDVVIPLADGQTTAIASIFLEVLFGQRNTTISGATTLPPSDHCSFAASSTLDGEARTGMFHEWQLTVYPGGEPVSDGAGDTFTPTLFNEGWYWLALTGTDQYGYETGEGRVIQVTSEAPGC